MATYTTPEHIHEDRIIERDQSSSGVWAVLAAIVVVLAVILLASGLIRSRNNNNPTPPQNNTNITVPSTQTPSGDTNTNPSTPYIPNGSTTQ